MDLGDYVSDRYTLEVDVEKFGGSVFGGNAWKPDLLKLYWQNVGIMTCHLCDSNCTDGYGIQLSSGTFRFVCSKLSPLRTGLESIEITGCQGYEGYASDDTKLRICKSQHGFNNGFGKYSSYLLSATDSHFHFIMARFPNLSKRKEKMLYL